MRKIYRTIEAAAVAVLSILLVLAASAGEEYNRQAYNGPVGGGEFISLEHSINEKVQELLPQRLMKVGFVQAGHESDWRIAVTKSCVETFSEENGYELYFVDADGSPKVQVSAVRNFIKEQVDYILIDPIVSTGWTAVLKEADHADIPVFLLNGRIDCRKRYYKAWYGPDYALEGECAGQWLHNYLSKSGQGSRLIRILLMNAAAGEMEQSGRLAGFAEYMERNRNWKILSQDYEKSKQSTVRQTMEECLEKYTDVDVVICQNDHAALEVCDVLEEAGRSYGTDGDVIILSFGAALDGLKAVYQGKINADFECSPLAPVYAAQAIQRLEAGEVLEEKNNYLPQKCYSLDGSMYLVTSAGLKKMVPVTEELLNDMEIKSK